MLWMAMVVGQLMSVATVDDKPWVLDAGGAITFQKSSPGEGGEAEVSTSFIALPHPFRPNHARILRADGTVVRVGEGLEDVGRSKDLGQVASWRRKGWIKIAAWQWPVVGLTMAGGGLGASVLAVAAWWVQKSLQGRDLLSIREQPPQTAAQMALGPLLVMVGGSICAGALLAWVFTLRTALNSSENAWQSTAANVVQSDQWPVNLAAEVVQEHNKRVLKGPEGRPPQTPPQEPGDPQIIPS